MEIKQLEIILKDTHFEHLTGSIESVELNGVVYKNLFKAGNKNTGYFAVKTRKKENKFVVDSLYNTALINDTDDFINKSKDIIEKSDRIVIISNWLNGIQPIHNHKEYLPKFFELLAHFNKRNIAKGLSTSMYTYNKYFDKIDDLINWEIIHHKKYFQGIYKTNEIIKILGSLKNGFPCVILEDMNTGNLIVTDDGKYKYLDLDWIINGLNLYQFEKIDYFGFKEKKWYYINEKAKDCYTAYFETLGIKTEEANEQIRAFELLQILRINTRLICNEDDSYDEEEIKNRIKTVMEHNKFI
ncbi:MAG: hypothetical protein FWC97_06105 [Treponema sp.]|nr:hypothetical protein [Treponema sp.]